MEDTVLISWQAKEYEFKPKEGEWYWTVGIAAAGVAISSLILGNFLFALIALLGGFTAMIVGSKRPSRHTYKLTERGFMIGPHLVPYSQISRFAIREDAPRKLTIETKTLSGVLNAPLGSVDHRFIREELKNRNIEEAEKLDSFVDAVVEQMGL